MNYKSILQKCLFSAFPKNSEKEGRMHNKVAGHLRQKSAFPYPVFPMFPPVFNYRSPFPVKLNAALCRFGEEEQTGKGQVGRDGGRGLSTTHREGAELRVAKANRSPVLPFPCRPLLPRSD